MKGAKMKTFYIDVCDLDKWLHQNGAEIIADYDGCLIDNLLCETKNGATMALYEHYVNCWTSNYYVQFSKDEKEKIEISGDFAEKAQEIMLMERAQA